LSPKKLTYDMLKVGVMSSHANYVNGQWDIDTVKQLLYSLLINNEAIHGILNHAQNARAIKLLENEPNNSKHFQILSRHRDEHPSLYECWPFLAAWSRGVPLELHVDVPMHLLFLGVTKTVTKRVMEWKKAHNLMNNFLQVSSSVLDAVASCNIEWCVALKLTNFGGWVSENFFALARLGKWFYSLPTTLNKDEDYVEPSRPCTTWSIKELKGWLKNFGSPQQRLKV
jgi:hypothetical protein